MSALTVSAPNNIDGLTEAQSSLLRRAFDGPVNVAGAEWQSARALVSKGLLRQSGIIGSNSPYHRITQAGRDAVRAARQTTPANITEPGQEV